MLNRRSFFAAMVATPAAASLPQTTRGPSADPERFIEYVLSRNQFLVDSICKLAAENERLRDERDRPVSIPVLSGPGKPARELIQNAFVTMGVLAPGQCPASADNEYALGVLNEIVAREGWGMVALDSRIPLVYCLELRETLALALSPSYNLGRRI